MDQKVIVEQLMKRRKHVAFIALFVGFSFAAFHYLIAVTVGTQHGDECHLDLLDAKASVWRT